MSSKYSTNTVEHKERIFWNLMEKGFHEDALKTWYGSDVALDTINIGRSNTNSRRRRRDVSTDNVEIGVVFPKWHVGNLNDHGLLRHAEQMHGINIPMYYVGGCCSYFPFHVEDEDLCSISYIHTGDPKVWYVTPRQIGVDSRSFVLYMY